MRSRQLEERDRGALSLDKLDQQRANMETCLFKWNRLISELEETLKQLADD